jgi:hypothetical protein
LYLISFDGKGYLMKAKIRMAVLSLGMIFSMAFASGAVVYAADTQSKTDACAGLAQLDPNQVCDSSAGQVDGPVAKLIKAVVTILTIIIGVASVIMIIVGGLKYITSGGDSNAISSAKNTVLYALVGLVVAVLAQFLVHFVVDKITHG